MSVEVFSDAVNVSRETLDRLSLYVDLLSKWNPRINLVAKSTLADAWTRHILDSAQVFDLASDAAHWADLGTGGGFPGVVVAILAAEKNPKMRVTCIESDLRKATFLRTVLRETGVSGEVISARIENVPSLGADIVSARALAPLSMLLEFTDRHLIVGGSAVFLKGAGHEKEVKEALETWAFQADTYPSKTHPDAVILKIGGLHRA